MTPTTTEPDATDEATPRYLQRIDLRTALLVAGVFNAILGAAFAIVGFLVIGIAAQRGFLDQINSAAADLSTGKPMHLGAFRLCVVWFVIVVGWTVAMTVLAGLAAVIFNTVLRTFGGVELSLTHTRGDAPDVRLHAARAGRVIADASGRGAVGVRRGAVHAGRGARVAGRWAAATAGKARDRLPTPLLRFDSGSLFRGLMETGATPGRAPARSAPAANAREAVQSKSSRPKDPTDERPTVGSD